MKILNNFVGRFLQRHVVSLSVTLLLSLFLVVSLADKIFINIPAGHAGVLWERFRGGTNVEKVYAEGLRVISPWNRMSIYNTRLREATNSISVLAKDGLELHVEFLVRYRPVFESLGILHKYMGENYLKVLIMPEVNSRGRAIMSKYSPEEIYSSKRQIIQEQIQLEVSEELMVDLVRVKEDKGPIMKNKSLGKQDKRLVFIEDILLKTITLPATVKAAIEAKVEHRHRMLQYEYILAREGKESQRKVIEALGISEFQKIVKNGISDRYLRWKGIDATLALAKSNNAKVVIIGAGKEGMPLILGNMGAQSNSSDASGDVKIDATTDKAPAIDLTSEPSKSEEPTMVKPEPRKKISFKDKALELLSFGKEDVGQNGNVKP
ncbi:MAG: peptidase [Rhodospirillaceae bacterium]|nr:MAG: peptidase [Rhodospirillaceae bacterium]